MKSLWSRINRDKMIPQKGSGEYFHIYKPLFLLADVCRSLIFVIGMTQYTEWLVLCYSLETVISTAGEAMFLSPCKGQRLCWRTSATLETAHALSLGYISQGLSLKLKQPLRVRLQHLAHI